MFGWLQAADLALKLFGGFAKGKQQQNQAKAVKVADQQKYKNEGDYWRAKEAHRATGVDHAQALLGGLQGSYGKGAPNYTLSPEIAAKMREARPFPGSLPPDPTKGSTWGLLGDIAQRGQGATEQTLLGREAAGRSYADSGNNAANAGSYIVDGVPITTPGVQSLPGGGEDRARICALSPSLPGCPKPATFAEGE